MGLRRPLISRRLLAAAAVLALVGAVAGCYSPTIEDGSLACASGSICPRGFVCRESDKLCHRHADAAAEKVSADAPVESAPTDAHDAAAEVVLTDAHDAMVDNVPADAHDAAVDSGPPDARDAPVESAPTDAHDAPVDSGLPDTRDAGFEAPPGPKSNGSACAQPSECASEYCVDGVCCNAACTERCKACDIATSRGTCTHVTSGQPRGIRATCAGSGPCAAGSCSVASPTACTYPGDETTCRSASCAGATFTARGGCNGAGACSNVVTVSCGDLACNASGTACLTACTSDNQCVTTARRYCDDSRCVSGRANGARCQAGAECASQRCVDGYCCNDACQGSCQACDVAGHLGACWPVPSGTPYGGRPPCGGTGDCAGSCNNLTSGQCFFPGPQQSCSCPSGVSGTCDGTGGCQLLVGVCI
jgi:hypothetical protein